MKKIEPLNTDNDGCAHCIKSGYYKMGLTNFMREEWGRRKDGFIATGVIEYETDIGEQET